MARLNTRQSVPSSRQASATPRPGNISDQENRDPGTGARQKGKQRVMPPSHRSSLPTPSDGSDTSRGHKRRRIDADSHPTQGAEEGDEDLQRFNKYFNPNQDPEIRRAVKRKSRALEREFQGEEIARLHLRMSRLLTGGQRRVMTSCARVAMRS